VIRNLETKDCSLASDVFFHTSHIYKIFCLSFFLSLAHTIKDVDFASIKCPFEHRYQIVDGVEDRKLNFP
jgi:hypothetical protein